MRAMLLEAQNQPLRLVDLPVPKPGPRQVLLEIKACAVCRTDLHVVDGDLEEPKLPLILGHEIIGIVRASGEAANQFAVGDRVGVPWLGGTCHACSFCTSGRENLCDEPRFTGYQLDGGFAEYTVADERFCFSVPARFSDEHAAPLLCAGLIGYRALRMTEDAERLGLYGFGAAAHIIAQVARHQKRKVYAFTRSGDQTAQDLAKKLGAVWAGDSTTLPPDTLDAAILFAPVGSLVPQSLRAVAKGGVVVCAGIHMSDIPSFPYSILWGERVVRSVANLTRQDGEELLSLIAEIPDLTTEIVRYPLEEANSALTDLREGRISGAAVLHP